MLLHGIQVSNYCKQPLLWKDHLLHYPENILRDFNPKSKFDPLSKSINGYLESKVASSSINMLLTLVQKSWERERVSKIKRHRKKNINDDDFTKTKSTLPVVAFCAL